MENEANPSTNAERIYGSQDSTPVSDELRRLKGMLTPLCPPDTVISFEFSGDLLLHLDIRRFEEMTTIEAMLPTICGGIFRDVHRGMAAKHSFFHRLSASVAV
jgi:hypothetical protein